MITIPLGLCPPSLAGFSGLVVVPQAGIRTLDPEALFAPRVHKKQMAGRNNWKPEPREQGGSLISHPEKLISDNFLQCTEASRHDCHQLYRSSSVWEMELIDSSRMERLPLCTWKRRQWKCEQRSNRQGTSGPGGARLGTRL